MSTPNQLALLPVPNRIYGLQTVDGYTGEKYKAFICYGCLDCGLGATYPHMLSIELIKPLVKS